MAQEQCLNCSGTGRTSTTGPVSCYTCGGRGVNALGDTSCTSCGGSGQTQGSKMAPCPSCGGSGSRYVPDPPAKKPNSKPQPKKPKTTSGSQKTAAAKPQTPQALTPTDKDIASTWAKIVSIVVGLSGMGLSLYAALPSWQPIAVGAGAGLFSALILFSSGGQRFLIRLRKLLIIALWLAFIGGLAFGAYWVFVKGV